MPRQGVRKKQRERAQAAKKVKKTELKETQGAPQSPKAVESRAADMEAVLAKGEANEKLFELANRPKVAINVAGSSLEAVQDRSTQEHSGGVVWETALFLLRYLERRVLPGLRAASKPRVVELGSGCGLLGLGLARLGCQVTLTDQLCALPNLQSNVEAAGTTAKVQALSWGDPSDVAAVCSQGPVDLVVGSDVVFAMRFVEPLLQTIEALLQGQTSGCCWLCLQRRDPDAHALLLQKAPETFTVEEFSFEGLAGLETACALECLLLKLTPKEAKGFSQLSLAVSKA